MFRSAGEQMFMMKSAVAGWPSVVSGILVQSIGRKTCERGHFTISELECEFPKMMQCYVHDYHS
jgi:hypothetical protein